MCRPTCWSTREPQFPGRDHAGPEDCPGDNMVAMCPFPGAGTGAALVDSQGICGYIVVLFRFT